MEENYEKEDLVVCGFNGCNDARCGRMRLKEKRQFRQQRWGQGHGSARDYGKRRSDQLQRRGYGNVTRGDCYGQRRRRRFFQSKGYGFPTQSGRRNGKQRNYLRKSGQRRTVV